MIRSLASLKRNEDGSTMIEFTIVMLLFFLLTFGIVEFGYLFWQYNSAAKATQVGARMAAVSNPVWSPLTTLASTGTLGGPWQTNYNVTCQGANATGSSVSCTGTSAGANVNVTSNNVTTLQDLVFGRGQTTCGTIGTDGVAGMCDLFWRITPQNVRINYRHTGLGFAGRPGGPVPTITLHLTGLTFEFIALGALMGFDEITMPDFKVTMTGEDLNGAAP